MFLEELFGEMFKPKERRLCASGILFAFSGFSSTKMREEFEDAGERGGLAVEGLRVPFFKSVGSSWECERKKEATRCGISRLLEACLQPKSGERLFARVVTEE
jgi:hypothetical protein